MIDKISWNRPFKLHAGTVKQSCFILLIKRWLRNFRETFRKNRKETLYPCAKLLRNATMRTPPPLSRRPQRRDSVSCQLEFCVRLRKEPVMRGGSQCQGSYAVIYKTVFCIQNSAACRFYIIFLIKKFKNQIIKIHC